MEFELVGEATFVDARDIGGDDDEGGGIDDWEEEESRGDLCGWGGKGGRRAALRVAW